MALSMGGSADMMSETGKPAEEDFSGIPLIERVEHKNFKARQSAYIELISKFSRTGSDDDPIFRPFSSGDVLKKWVMDSHAMAQEKGVEAVMALVQNSGESSARTRSEVVPALVEKCLGSARAQTKTKAIELTMMYVEVENGGEGVVMDVLKGMDAKSPKAVAAAVQCLAEIVRAFGTKTLGDIKPLTGSLPKMFDHKDKVVREQATLLCQALYRYLGPILPPLLAELKPAQLKDLQVKFDEMDKAGENGKCVPERLTRKAQREVASREAARGAGAGSGGGGGSDEAAVEEQEEIDPLSLIEAVNIVPKIPETFLTQITATKWSEKVEACTELKAEVVKVLKIQNTSDLAPYVEALASKLKESHAAVINAAVGVLTELAKRIEDKGFGKYKGVVLPAAMLKFTEKRAIPILAQLLDDTFACCELNDVIEECATQSKNKSAAVKENSMAFLVRCLCSTKHAPRKDDIKTIVDICIGVLGDAAGPIRQQGIAGLAAMQKIVGERIVNSLMEDVPELQKKMVADAVATTEVKFKVGSAPPPAARAAALSGASAPAKKFVAKAPARAPPATKAPAPNPAPAVEDDGATGSDPIPGQYADFMDDPNAFPSGAEAPSKPRAAPPARLAAKFAPKKAEAPVARSGPPVRAAPSAKPAAATGKAVAPTVSGPEAVTFKHTSEEALAEAEEAIPAEMRTLYSSAAWKERITALENMIVWVKEDAGKDVEAEVLARYFEKPLNGGEKLIQVTVKIFEVFAAMAENSPSFGKAAASLSIGPMVDKLGDLKAKKVVGDALVLYAEKTSLGFVLSQALQPMVKLKVAKAQTESLAWVKSALTDFGIAGVPIKDLVSFLKIGLQNAQAAVRAAAIEALVTVKLFIGPDVLNFLEDLNPQLLTTITSEFEKVDGQTPPVPTRKSAGLPTAAAGGKGKGGGDPLDQLVPRVDLDKLVKETSFIADCKSDSFKERKAGADALLAVLDIKANSRLKPNMGDAGAALKGRMGDSNLGVKMTCLTIISKIAAGMGSGFVPHAKLLTPSIALLLCDQKAMTRNAALETLSNIATACEGVDPMIPGLATAMESPNSVARGLIGNFIIAAFKENMPARSTDLTPLMQPIFLSLEDKIAEARKAATLLLPYAIANVGFSALTDKASSLKPASRATVTSALQAAKAAGLPVSKSEERVAPVPTLSAPAPATRPAQSSSVSRPAMSTAAPGPPAAVRAGSMATKANALRPPSGLTVEVEESSIALPKPSQMGYRAKLTSRSGIPAAGAAGPARSSAFPEATPSNDRSPPFITMDLDSKQQRAKRDISRWSFDTQTTAQLMEYLHKQMDGHATPELMQQLFSADRMAEKDHVAGLSALEDFYSPETSFYGLPADSMKALRLANSDLAVKYAAIRMHDGSTQMTNKCLEVLANIVHVVDEAGGAGFSDTETNVLLPALIAKLGDRKFADRLASIFGVIDRAVPASKVLQYYVDYGVGSSNSKTRATAMENLAQLIRRRGDVAASSTAGPRLYKRIAEQIASADAATRSAALDCMAFLHKHTGDNIQALVADLKPKERDMLNNRIEKLASAPALRAVQPTGLQARSSPQRTGPNTPARGISARGSPMSSPSPEAAGRASGSGASRPPSSIASKSNNTSPSSEGAQTNLPRGQIGLSRMPQPRSVLRNGHPPNDPVPAQSSGSAPDRGQPLRSAISSVTSPDPDASVDALKRLRHIIEESPAAVDGHGEELISVITVQFRRILSRKDGLRDPKLFRLLKHLVETLSNLCDNAKLVHDLSVNAMRGLLDQLTLGLIGTDTATEPIIRDMSRHLNNTIVRFFGSGKRSVVFEALFTLFQQIAVDFDPMTMESAIETRHAELVLKCIWKRSRSAEDDLVKGLLDPKDVFRIIENFLQAIPPKDWRLRATQKVPLGDMPLRTIKVLIQHIGTQCGTELAVEKLHEAFGDRAEDTIVYEYVYRLIKMQMANAEAGPSRHADAMPDRPSSAETATAAAIPVPASPSPAQGSLVEDELDAKLDGLVRHASSASGANEGIPLLYDFLRAHPHKREKYDQMLDHNLGADSRYKMFIKRKLDRLESENQPEAKSKPAPTDLPKPEESARQSAPFTNNLRQTNRVSVGPRTTIPADADDDTRLALLKDKFQFFAQTGANE